MHTARSKPSIGRQWIAAAAIAAAAVVAVPFAGAPPASAVETTPVVESGVIITPQGVLDGIEDIKAAGIPYTMSQGESGAVITFHFEQGDFALAVPTVGTSSGTVSPNLATGWDGGMTYISLNHTDQVAIQTGATGAMVVAITLLNPVVGALAGLAVSVAGTYIGNNGMCPSNDELWIYFTEGATGPNYQQVICRPVSYPGGG